MKIGAPVVIGFDDTIERRCALVDLEGPPAVLASGCCWSFGVHALLAGMTVLTD